MFQGPDPPVGGVGGNRFRETLLAGLPVPLLADYVLGFDSQKYDEEIGLALLCTQTGLNWAFRYSLPALPVLFVAAGVVIRDLSANTAGRLLLAVCLAWNAAAASVSRLW